MANCGESGSATRSPTWKSKTHDNHSSRSGGAEHRKDHGARHDRGRNKEVEHAVPIRQSIWDCAAKDGGSVQYGERVETQSLGEAVEFAEYCDGNASVK